MGGAPVQDGETIYLAQLPCPRVCFNDCVRGCVHDQPQGYPCERLCRLTNCTAYSSNRVLSCSPCTQTYTYWFLGEIPIELFTQTCTHCDGSTSIRFC